MENMDALIPHAKRSRDATKQSLFHAKTNLFYDYDPDHRFDHLPTRKEIQRQKRNREFMPLRGPGESLLTRLVAPESNLTEKRETFWGKIMQEISETGHYDLAFTHGMLYPQAAF